MAPLTTRSERAVWDELLHPSERGAADRGHRGASRPVRV